MRCVSGRAVGALSFTIVAACSGGGFQAIDPVTFVAAPAVMPTTIAPRYVAADGELADAIESRHEAAATVVASPAFARALSSIGLLAVAPDAAEATDVVGAVVATRAFSTAAPVAYRTARSCGSATASTALTTIDGAPGATITLFTATLARLHASDRETTACVINTLVHEWTHIAREGNDYAYVDTGRGATTRPLVSYTVGAIAQCVYLAGVYRQYDPSVGFALERCIAVAAVIPFDPGTCAVGWGQRFVVARSELLW